MPSPDHGMSQRSARTYGPAAFGFLRMRILAIEASGKACSQALSKRGTVMKPARPSFPKPIDRRRFGHMGRTAVAILALVALAGCEQNTFVPPPPPKVEVAVPVQRPITRYLETTGST